MSSSSDETKSAGGRDGNIFDVTDGTALAIIEGARESSTGSVPSREGKSGSEVCRASGSADISVPIWRRREDVAATACV